MQKILIGLAVAFVASLAFAGAASAHSPDWKSCGYKVQANTQTSCAFASKVARAAYWSNWSRVIRVYSPTTHQSYTMRATYGRYVTYRGGNGAAVRVTP